MSFREKLEVRERVDSTNRVLLEEPLGTRHFGSSVMALEQSSGRGRAGRVWRSGLGGMYISTLLLPVCPEGLALLGALSVIDLLEQKFDLRPILRWPNDVLVQGRKIAGILPAARYRGSRLERAVLGTGLNVSQPLDTLVLEQGIATTLLEECGARELPDTVELAGVYLDTLEGNFEVLEARGGQEIARRAELYLEGKNSDAAAVIVDDLGRNERVLGRVFGLGPLGELKLEDGSVLSGLGPTERLRFR